MTKNNIPLEKMLRAIDTNDFDFYAKLSEDEKKAFSPWLAMRWASSAKGSSAYHYLLMVNDIVNVQFSSLKNHPELQWKLLAVCGIGKYQGDYGHPWVPPGGKRKANKVQKFLQDAYPALSRDEIELWIAINTKDDIRRLAMDRGLDDKDIKELLK